MFDQISIAPGGSPIVAPLDSRHAAIARICDPANTDWPS